MDAIFDSYLKTYSKERSSEVSENRKINFVSIDFAISAFEKGKKVGEDEMKKKVRKNIEEKMKLQADETANILNQIYKIFKEKGFVANKLFLSIDIDSTKLLFTVPEKQHYSEEFMNVFYSLSANFENKYLKNNMHFYIGAIDESENINLNLLKSDGYTFGYDLKNNKPLY